MNLDTTIDELHQRLARYAPRRYPVQHATTQFHLGQALLQADRPEAALEALRASLQWFPAALAVERAKALNLLGAALRATGQLDLAAAAFVSAADTFAARRLSAEHGAALFNLGLVRRDAADPAGAADVLADAREHLRGGPVAPQAAAALQHGSALLDAGQLDAAVAALREAIDLAERGAGPELLGASANALGLALRASGAIDEAVEVLGLAVAAHPRPMRPVDHAMAKANLALAHADAGRAAHALLAARQALAVAEAAPPVLAQARAIVERCPRGDGSVVLAVLTAEPHERWPSLLRDELARWTALADDERTAEATAWVEGLRSRHDREALHHDWLGALLELPPQEMDGIVTALLRGVASLPAEAGAAVRSEVTRAMARLPVPQLLRLRDRFAALAQVLGQEASWS